MSGVDAVEGVLRREVGGLPVIAWAGIVGAGIIVGRRLAGGGLFGGRSSGGEATPFTDPNLTGYTATGEPASSGSLGGGNPGRPTFTDNAAWRRAAIDYLVAQGVQPVDAERAIGRALAGETLQGNDAAIYNTAVRALGSPPDGIPVPTTTNPPPTGPPGTPRPPRYTTVLAPYGLGENLNQVAARIRRAPLLGGLGVTTTTDGRPLTAAYLANVNGLGNVPVTKALRKGTRINY